VLQLAQGTVVAIATFLLWRRAHQQSTAQRLIDQEGIATAT
jgi:hypothetical protein